MAPATLRNRARYEVANNSYARGIVLTLANDVVGTGDAGHAERRAKMSFHPRVYGKLSSWAVLAVDQHHIQDCSS